MREDLEAEYFRRDWFAQRSEEDQEKIDRAAFFSIDHPGIYPVFPDVAHVLGVLKQEIPTVFETPPAALAKAAPTNAPPRSKRSLWRCVFLRKGTFLLEA